MQDQRRVFKTSENACAEVNSADDTEQRSHVARMVAVVLTIWLGAFIGLFALYKLAMDVLVDRFIP